MGVLFSINTTTTMRSNVRRAAPLIRSAIQFQRRSFSVSNARQAQYGFIGLGQMGYNMARNLQAKLPSTDTIRVYDINAESVDRFANDTKALSTGASVQVAATAREAAEDSETTITVLPEPTRRPPAKSPTPYMPHNKAASLMRPCPAASWALQPAPLHSCSELQTRCSHA